MTKQELINAFQTNHKELVDFVNSLTDDQFIYRHNEKWTAGQQLQHIYLTLLPFPKALSSKEYLLHKFGKINRPIWNYDTVIENYLKSTLQAPQTYLPEQINADQKGKIASDILYLLTSIQHLLNDYSDEELDTLVLPHPLLGNLTLREMFYLMTYHAAHHSKQTKLNLVSYTVKN